MHMKVFRPETGATLQSKEPERSAAIIADKRAQKTVEQTSPAIERATFSFFAEFLRRNPQRDEQGALRYYFTDDTALLLLACANQITLNNPAHQSARSDIPQAIDADVHMFLHTFRHPQERITTVSLDGGEEEQPIKAGKRTFYTSRLRSARTLFSTSPIARRDVSEKVRGHHTVVVHVGDHDAEIVDPSILLGLRIKKMFKFSGGDHNRNTPEAEILYLIRTLSRWYDESVLLDIARTIAFSRPPSQSVQSIYIPFDRFPPEVRTFFYKLADTSSDREYFSSLPFWEYRKIDLAWIFYHFQKPESKQLLADFIKDHEQLANPIEIIKPIDIHALATHILDTPHLIARVQQTVPSFNPEASNRFPFLEEQLKKGKVFFEIMVREAYKNEESDVQREIFEPLPSPFLRLLWHLDEDRLTEELHFLREIVAHGGMPDVLESYFLYSTPPLLKEERHRLMSIVACAYTALPPRRTKRKKEEQNKEEQIMDSSTFSENLGAIVGGEIANPKTGESFRLSSSSRWILIHELCQEAGIET